MKCGSAYGKLMGKALHDREDKKKQEKKEGQQGKQGQPQQGKDGQGQNDQQDSKDEKGQDDKKQGGQGQQDARQEQEQNQNGERQRGGNQGENASPQNVQQQKQSLDATLEKIRELEEQLKQAKKKANEGDRKAGEEREKIERQLEQLEKEMKAKREMQKAQGAQQKQKMQEGQAKDMQQDWAAEGAQSRQVREDAQAKDGAADSGEMEEKEMQKKVQEMLTHLEKEMIDGKERKLREVEEEKRELENAIKREFRKKVRETKLKEGVNEWVAEEKVREEMREESAKKREELAKKKRQILEEGERPMSHEEMLEEAKKKVGEQEDRKGVEKLVRDMLDRYTLPEENRGRIDDDAKEEGGDGGRTMGIGNPNAPVPESRMDLSKWYWERAQVLEYKDVRIKMLTNSERENSRLELAKVKEAENMSMKVRPLRHRKLDMENDDIGDVDFGKMIITSEDPLTDEGVTFGVGRVHASVNAPVERQRSFIREKKVKENVQVESEASLSTFKGNIDEVERILFIRDSSGSMDGIYVGSRFDRVTLGLYSVLKTIEAKGKKDQFRLGMMDFSNRTIFSGFVKWKDLAKFEQIALTCQGGGSALDYRTLSKALEGGKTLVLMLTDGYIGIRGGEYGDVYELLKKHMSFVVAVDDVDQFCGGAARAGIKVLLIDDVDKVGEVFSAIICGE
jgi:hypothetical protein